MVQKLIPYLLDQIKMVDIAEERHKLIARIARMKIFPYIGADGEIYIGSLLENNVSWFYLSGGEFREERSSKNYRILSRKAMDDNIYNEIVRIFGPGADQSGYIHLFSNDVVIDAILDEMQHISDYSDDWWQGARDIYKLWNRQNSSSSFKRATRSIANNYFLFEEDYCDTAHKNMLLNLQVYKDIMRHPNAHIILDTVSEIDYPNIWRLLIMLGVPNRFSVSGNFNQHIFGLFEGVERNVKFPTDPSMKRDNILCELSSYVVFSVIRRDDPLGYASLLVNEQYAGGIAIRNVIDGYVSLKYSMFYGERINDNQEIPKELSNLENLHVPAPAYTQVRTRNYAIGYDSVNQSFSAYNVRNIRTDEITFYKWLWLYTHNDSLINVILNYLSTIGTTYIPNDSNRFALNVIDSSNYLEPQTYSFRLRITAAEAVEWRESINALYRNEYLANIFPIVSDALRKYDTNKDKYDIMSEVICDDSTRVGIERGEFWNRIYLLPDDLNVPNGTVIHVRYFLDGGYEPQPIILMGARDVSSRIRRYVSEMFDVTIPETLSEKRNWSVDYRNLSYGIRSFISTTVELANDIQLDNSILSLDDLGDLDVEKRLWTQLKMTRDAIMSNNDTNHAGINMEILGLRGFIREKYHGHCQICGQQALVDEENDESIRYRIHNEDRNAFSDISANILCLCPACRGDMTFGNNRRDMREVSRMANRYIVNLKKKLDETEVTSSSVISQLASEGIFESRFENPIISPVCINGKQEQIYFSWEHFVRIAFMFYDDEKDYTYEGEIGNFMQLLRMLANV